MRALIAVGFLLLCSQFAMAETRPTCDSISDILDTPRIARVMTSAKRLNLINGNDANCPADTAECRQKAYVVNKDVVIAGASAGEFVCVGVPLPGKSWATYGFLPIAALKIEQVRLEGWSGTWKARESTIKIKSRIGGAIIIDGSATYGMFDPVRVKNGGVNMGEFEAEARPDNDGNVRFGTDGEKTIPYVDGKTDACMIRMSRAGVFMLVEDNRNCGGHNVTFTGIYREKK